jgi:hypothetical protein
MNAVNRTLWIVIGVILIAAGVLGVLAFQGRIGPIARTDALLPGDLTERATSGSAWIPWLVIAAGVVAAVLGALLLRAQVRRPPAAWRALATASPSTGTAGHTVAGAGVVSRALQRDLEADPRIAHARVGLTGSREHPDVDVTVDLAREADLGDVARYVRTAVDRLGRTVGADPHVRRLEITPVRPGAGAVR